MRDVEGGDLSRRIPVDTVDEMGRLSQGFNSMLGRLSQADAQIRAFNQRLAAEIEAATHDLSEKNATLAQLNRLLNDMRLDNASKVRLATLGQLAAQLAHEIGTPLSSVSGHVQLALARARAAAGAARAARRVGARDRADQQDRARLSRFDAAAGAGAPADGPAAPAGGGGRDRAGRRAREAGAGHLEGDARHRRCRHRSGPAAPDRRQSAVERARRRRSQTAASTSRRARSRTTIS